MRARAGANVLDDRFNAPSLVNCPLVKDGGCVLFWMVGMKRLVRSDGDDEEWTRNEFFRSGRRSGRKKALNG